ncbi:YbhB/YbcL family Raf kinase inhibitor-like protein [Parasediminibacterium sp. JCM 36343]|uniref:YbhB/YbcL family Raf kinase inhibitor-like protein n=1 Tax=Parasediminibacterium sp. JCM 36343 TaxID=3374279 RepID=UPI00397D2127
MKLKNVLIASCLLFACAANAQTFTLKSTDIGGSGTKKEEFNGFGCSGQNVSPELSWENVPVGTKSFAVTLYDKDAPTGSGFWHWVVFDLPASTTELKAGAGNVSAGLLPKMAIQGKTDYGVPGYGGPCPPPGHGFHQYLFTVYALKTEKLGLDANASPAVVGFYLNQQTIGKASIVMYYQR